MKKVLVLEDEVGIRSFLVIGMADIDGLRKRICYVLGGHGSELIKRRLSALNLFDCEIVALEIGDQDRLNREKIAEECG